MNSQEILDDVGGLFLHLLNLLTKTIFLGGLPHMVQLTFKSSLAEIC